MSNYFEKRCGRHRACLIVIAYLIHVQVSRFTQRFNNLKIELRLYAWFYVFNTIQVSKFQYIF